MMTMPKCCTEALCDATAKMAEVTAIAMTCPATHPARAAATTPPEAGIARGRAT
jgi:hypothetical protein